MSAPIDSDPERERESALWDGRGLINTPAGPAIATTEDW